MDILQYLQPDNPLALGLVWALQALFALWFLYLLYMWASIAFQQSTIKRGEDIEELAEQLTFFLNKKRGKKEKSNGENESDSREGPEESDEEEDETLESLDETFSTFCLERGIKENNTIGIHIKTIFEAGIHDSRLNAGELIKHTAGIMFRGNTLLKTFLGSFIVIGLLGTLLGLTDSLASLSPVLAKSNGAQSSQDLSAGLSKLFVSLKTAFAPSIWGVAFTVLGLILLSLYLRAACFTANKSLEKATLTTWVPKLFLTTSQRLVDTLQVSENQIQQNLDAIQGVVDMQELVQEDVDELSLKLKSTNKALASVEGSASGLKAFTDSFENAVNKLTTYQEEIHNIYDRITHSAQIFQDNIRESAILQQTSLVTFQQQNETMQEMFKSLKSYENAYVGDRKNIDLKMQQMVETAQQSYKALSERNKEVIREVGKPIAEQLTIMDESLRAGLDGIEKHFGLFDAPISKAAEQIEGSLETVVNRTDAVTNELKNEFFTFNNNIQENLNDLIKGIETQSNRMADGTESQNKVSELMEEKVSLLSTNIDSLNSSVKALNESSKAGESVLSQMGQLGDFGKKIGGLIDTLDRGNKAQETQFKELIKQLAESSKSHEKQGKDLAREITSMKKQIKRNPTQQWGGGSRDFGTSPNPGDGEVGAIAIDRDFPGGSVARNRHPFLDFSRSPLLNLWKRLINKIRG